MIWIFETIVSGFPMFIEFLQVLVIIGFWGGMGLATLWGAAFTYSFFVGFFDELRQHWLPKERRRSLILAAIAFLEKELEKVGHD